jgi:hypothetical protein
LLSDTLIVYTEQVDDYSIILDLLFALDTFRTGLIEKGFFSRGAIVFGDNFIDKDIMVSPAFIEAYKIEEKICINPRLIISNCLAEKIIADKVLIAKDYVLKNHEARHIKNKVVFTNYCNNMISILSKLICKDEDSKYILYPFVGIDNIALYYFDKYKMNPSADLRDEKIRYIKFLKNTVNRIKDGICMGFNRADDDKSKAKATYLINIFNTIIGNLSIDNRNKEALKISINSNLT